MTAPPSIAALLLVLCACRPYQVGVPVGDETGDSPDTSETQPPGDTQDSDTSRDTGTETIPAGQSDPIFEPNGGGFVDAVTVTLGSSNDTGEILYCATTPDDICELEPYTEPFELTRSSIVHARVDAEGIEGERHARSFFSMDAALASFESNIPVLVYWTHGAAPSSSTTLTPLGLDVFDPGEETGLLTLGDEPSSSGRCRMKTRGSSTGSFSKRSYDMELWQAGSEEDRREELGGMPADGDWVLYAPYYFDNALIRNALGYDLSNRIGRYAPRTRQVELFVAAGAEPVSEADYVGVYTLTEEIERADHRVAVTEIFPDDVEEPEVTGGYVFKRDREGTGETGIWAGLAGGAFSFDEPLVWVDPEETEISPPQAAYLAGVVDVFAWSLLAKDFTDPTTGLHYSELIDVDAWIDHHILNVVFKNPDCFRLSGYHYKDREGLIVAGPMWDLDRTAGAEDSRAAYPTWWDASNQTSDTTPVFTYGWYGGLFEDPDFRDRYWARWQELLQGELSSDNIVAVIQQMAEELDGPARRNSERWSTPEFSAEIAALRGWMEQRMAWIETCIETWEDPRECPG